MKHIKTKIEKLSEAIATKKLDENHNQLDPEQVLAEHIIDNFPPTLAYAIGYVLKDGMTVRDACHKAYKEELDDTYETVGDLIDQVKNVGNIFLHPNEPR